MSDYEYSKLSKRRMYKPAEEEEEEQQPELLRSLSLLSFF
jgi:hypothetical protein